MGTAKFITDFGGSQGNQFCEAIRFLKEGRISQNVKRIAIIDGVAWLQSKSKRGRKTQNILLKLAEDKFCLSALLLQEFLSEIKK